MCYSYEFKMKCIEMYREGVIPDVPKGITRKRFLDYIRIWTITLEKHGPEALRQKNQNKYWSPDEKLELVSKVLAGSSVRSTALDAGINQGALYSWVQKYQEFGYNGLITKAKGRKTKESKMKNRTIEPKTLNESEREELIRLRAENEVIKAEIEVIKKEIALRQEKEAARLKAKKQKSLKNSEKKDIN